MKFDFGTVAVRKRHHLPHWLVQHGIYFVTWHLADAIPLSAQVAIRQQCDWYTSLLQSRRGRIESAELELIAQMRRRLLNRTLDQNLGTSLLHGETARIVGDAIEFFDSTRYDLLAWCVMPNHAHVVFSADDRAPLDRILHSWKSFTANRINELLGRSGPVWAEGYFDTTMRDTRQLQRTVAYVLTNPEKAGLVEWPYRCSYPDAIGRAIG